MGTPDSGKDGGKDRLSILPRIARIAADLQQTRHQNAQELRQRDAAYCKASQAARQSLDGLTSTAWHR